MVSDDASGWVRVVSGCHDRPVKEPPDLSASMPSLLWAALRQLERAHEDEGAGRTSMPTLGLWSNVLRVLDESGVDRRDLARLARVSKRAAKSRLAEAVRGGWAEALPSGGSVARVRWTARGSQAASWWPALCHGAEQRWRAKVGDEVIDKFRASIEAVVARLPLEHPHYPATYGAADASVTGGPGQDWSAVRRTGDGGVRGLPLSALVSQAAVHFAVGYEERSDVAFSLAARVLTKVPAEGRPLVGLARTAWLSALERHRYVRATGESGPAGPAFVLTERGRRCAGGHNDLVEQVEAAWATEYGNALVGGLREALDELQDR